MILRIRSRSDFAKVRQAGIRVRSGTLSCTMLIDHSLSGPAVGYAIGRSYGNAVSRNQLKRRLREIVKPHSPRLAPGLYVFGASPRAAKESFSSLERTVARLIDLFPATDRGQG